VQVCGMLSDISIGVGPFDHASLVELASYPNNPKKHVCRRSSGNAGSTARRFAALSSVGLSRRSMGCAGRGRRCWTLSPAICASG
jgi:hypothetical protein